MSAPSLLVENLRVCFRDKERRVIAVDGVSFEIPKGCVVGIVGESGCGKSVTALSLINLLPQPPGEIESGRVLWKGEDLLKADSRKLASIRGREIAMIFQDPMTSLNPVFTIRRIMGEIASLRLGIKGAAVEKRLREVLREVGISDPDARLEAYPHELSGGLKQRIMIALALLGSPKLLIADEPTTALDVTVQKQILFLMKRLQRERDMSMILITHDLGVVAEMCDQVIVMYAGRIVEQAPVTALFDARLHPYTDGLFRSIPRPGQTKAYKLATIGGSVPTLLETPKGCRFATRCAYRQERCGCEDPMLQGDRDHRVACFFPMKSGGES